MDIYHNHIYAKSKDNGGIVFINDVENGLECNCVCTKCGSILVAKANQKNKLYKKESHFAHYKLSECNGESLEHIRAKEIIKSHKYLWLPNLKGSEKVLFDDVKVEELIGDSKYRADLICMKNNKEFIVEIVVTHDMEDEKIHYLQNNNITTLSIYLDQVLSNGKFSEKRFSDYVLKDSKRKWVINSALIRQAQELYKDDAPPKGLNPQEIKAKMNTLMKGKLSLVGYEVWKLKKKNSKGLIFGTLVRANIKNFGGWGMALCVKSKELSSEYGYLAFVHPLDVDENTDFLGTKVGIKLDNEFDYNDDDAILMPRCRIMWNEKTSKKF